MAPDADDFRQMSRTLGTAHACVTPEQVRDSVVAGNVVLDYLRYLWHSAVVNKPRSSAMAIYMSDGWGSFVNKIATAKLGEHQVVRNG